MAGQKSKKISRKDIQGFKYFKVLSGLTEHLHDVFVDPKHPNKRVLHYDQYIALILLHLFTPACDSLRKVQQVTELDKVQKLLGVPRFGRSTLADAGKVFDPELLKGIIGQLADQVPDTSMSAISQAEIGQIVTLVDGSYLPGIARMLWADYRHNTDRRAAKAHVQFELAKGVPVAGEITSGNASEIATFEQTLQKARLYVLDRGYAKYELLQKIIDAKSDFVIRLRENTVLEVVEERELDQAALDAGVVRDALVRVGSATNRDQLKQPIRIVEVECRPHKKSSGKTGRGGPEQGDTILIGTSRDDLPPEMIGMIYRQRWAIEIFFRFFKHVLGGRHLLGESQNAITLQLYVTMIACLLVAIYTGRKPTKNVWFIVNAYLTGWATEEEMVRLLKQLPDARKPKS